MNNEENNALHPFNDVDKIAINSAKEEEFALYRSFILALKENGQITEKESIATLNAIRKKLGLPFVDPFLVPKQLDNITL